MIWLPNNSVSDDISNLNELMNNKYDLIHYTENKHGIEGIFYHIPDVVICFIIDVYEWELTTDDQVISSGTQFRTIPTQYKNFELAHSLKDAQSVYKNYFILKPLLEFDRNIYLPNKK